MNEKIEVVKMAIEPSTKEQAKALITLGLMLVATATILPSFAHADIAGGLTNIKSNIFAAGKILAVAAIIGSGILKLMGRMNWAYFLSVCVGAVIIMSAQEIFGWFG